MENFYIAFGFDLIGVKNNSIYNGIYGYIGDLFNREWGEEDIPQVEKIKWEKPLDTFRIGTITMKKEYSFKDKNIEDTIYDVFLNHLKKELGFTEEEFKLFIKENIDKVYISQVKESGLLINKGRRVRTSYK